jgi:prepilin-type N-terminal cleavage/methylation domain-containing protein
VERARARQIDELFNEAQLMKSRGFTLLELMVSMALVSVILTAVVSAFGTMSSILSRTERQSELRSRAKALSDFFVSDLQLVGGGAVRPHMALHVENNVANARGAYPSSTDGPRTSDRLSYVRVLPGLVDCALTTASADITSSGGDFKTATITVKVPKPVAPDTGCILSGTWVNKLVHLTKDDFYSQRYVSSFTGDVTTGWTVTLKPGVYPASSTGEATKTAAEVLGTFAGGVLTRVAVVTVYLDVATHRLMAHINADDQNADSVAISPGESAVLAHDVYDFQALLGYDVDGDARLPRTGGTDDEWMFNAPSDATTGTLMDVSLSDLRAIRIGVVVGAKGLTVPAVVEGGASINLPGITAHATTANAMLRNTFIFQ